MAEREFIVSRTEMEELLQQEVLGCLGLAGEEGPYVVPLNYAYVDGRILFHCGLTGKKLDHIRANPQVCFCVARQTGRVDDHGKTGPVSRGQRQRDLLWYGTGGRGSGREKGDP